MQFLSEKIEDYITSNSEDQPKLLADLERETIQKILKPRMLSGHYQGRLLSLISKLINPKFILEIGTYTGYSALCLAEGLQKDGELHTIDNNEELCDFQRKYFDKSDNGNQIIQHLGNALEIIPTLNKSFDLVFIDADKENYVNYFHTIIDKTNSGGLIISDNVLWSGKLVEKLDPKDKVTTSIIKFNKLMKEDTRIETVILPIRDGLTLSRKI